MEQETLDRRENSLDRVPRRGSRRWVLVVIWSRRSAAQGEHAVVDERSMLGRPGGDGPVLRWFRGGQAGVGLAGPYLSRRQLQLRPGAAGLEVRNVGRLELRVNQTPVRRATCRAGDVIELHDELLLQVLHTDPELSWSDEGLVGAGPAITALRRSLAALGRGHVLITGPSGTGKELVARALHHGGPFVPCNAAAIPDGVAEAEWFGTERNYPNPGTPARPGFAGRADGGTLFVDEIGELPIRLQAQLLRLLDSGEVQRLGSDRTRTVQLRVVAATNRSPEALKHDLYARFPHRLQTPGLAERPEDLGLLVAHLLREQLPRFVVDGVPRVTPAFWYALLGHRWTGHVRELLQLLHQAAQETQRDWLDPPSALAATAPRPVQQGPLTAERVGAALEAHGGVKTRAAKALGVSRHQLARWLDKHG